MTKINRYWVKPVKTKKRRNMKYAGKPTKYQRAKQNKELLILAVFCVPFIIIQALLSTNDIKIDDAVVATEASAVCDNNGGAEKEIDTPSLAEPSYPSFVKRLNPTEEQIREIAREMNFPYENYIVNLACCEGLLDPSTTNTQGNSPPSRDRGLYGINDYWHSEVPDETAYDLRLSTIWTIKRINAGYQHEWVCDKFIKGKPNYYHKCLAIK